MYGRNEVILVGNLGAEPELRFTGTGKAVCNLRLAVEEPPFGDSDEKHTSWHDVVVWGKPAEQASKALRQGSAVFVVGRSKTRSYDDKEGVKRYRTEVVADIVGAPFFGERDSGAERPADRGDDRRDDRRQSAPRDNRGSNDRRPDDRRGGGGYVSGGGGAPSTGQRPRL